MVRVALFNNQGGKIRLGFYAGIARDLQRNQSEFDSVLVLWTKAEALLAKAEGVASVIDFESWSVNWIHTEGMADELNLRYPNVNWSEIIAAERSFTDYCTLLGAAGDRRENSDYVSELLARIVGFFEYIFDTFQIKAMMCPTADTLFTLVGFKVAQQKGVQAVAESAAWLLPKGMSGGGFLTADEYMQCPTMVKAYQRFGSASPSSSEVASAKELAAGIVEFDGKTAFYEKNKGKKAGVSILTPNLSSLFSYLATNAKRDKRIEYMQFEMFEKIRANVLRFFRRIAARNLLGSKSCDGIPAKSVFYALHYQPEQSTLAQGIWYSNQVALIENISKSLPLGYTLVVKEHPWGRGNRPAWQYRHLARFYNVIFCDAPAKQIIQKVDAVVAVAGTIAVESLVLDKPTVLLGKAFFDFSDLYYRVGNISDLPKILRRILVDQCHALRTDRDFEISRFLAAYQRALIPAFPIAENSAIYARALIDEIRSQATHRNSYVS